MPSERVRSIRGSLATFTESSDNDGVIILKLKLYSVSRNIALDALVSMDTQEGHDFREFLVFDPKGCQIDGITEGYTKRLIKRLARPNLLDLQIHGSLTVGDIQDLTDPELAVLCGDRIDAKIIRRLFGRTPH